jgi:hypothetical protein
MLSTPFLYYHIVFAREAQRRSNHQQEKRICGIAMQIRSTKGLCLPMIAALRSQGRADFKQRKPGINTGLSLFFVFSLNSAPESESWTCLLILGSSPYCTKFNSF